MKRFFPAVLAVLFTGILYAQNNVGIGTNTPMSTIDVNGAIGTGVKTLTSAQTLDNTAGTILANPSAGAFTITLPVLSTSAHRIYNIIYLGSPGGNTVTIKGNAAGDNITTGGTSANTFALTEGSIILQNSGSAWFATVVPANAGSGNYIQNQNSNTQTANFNISGTGTLGGLTDVGAANINASGSSATNIGNSLSTTAVTGPANINTTGGAATSIGNATNALTENGNYNLNNNNGSATTNIGTGSTGGAITVGGAGNTVNIGASTTGTVALGSTSSTTNISSGSGAVNVNNNNNQPTNINTGTSTGKVTIGGGSGTVAVNVGSDATGDIYYRNSSGNLARLGAGSSGQALSISSGIPAWVGGTGTGTSGFWSRTGTSLSPANTGDAISTSGTITTTNNTASSSTGTGAVVVTGGEGIGGNLNVGGNSAVTGTETITGLVTDNGGLTEVGAVNFNTTGSFNPVANINTGSTGTVTIGDGSSGASTVSIKGLTADAVVLNNTGGLLSSAPWGAPNTVLHGQGTTTAPSFAQVNLASGGDVTGVLPVANGGTGSSTQGWVDLTTNQTAAGNKTWTGTSVMGAGATSRAALGLTVSVNNATTYSVNTDITDAARQLSIVNEGTTANEMAVLSMRTNPGGGSNNQMLDMKFVDPNDGTGKLIYSFAPGGTFTDRFAFTSAGSFGIGNTSPNAKLDINGSQMINGGLTNTSTRPAIAAGTLANGELRGYSANGAAADDGFLRISAGAGTTAGTKSYIDLSGYNANGSSNDMYENIIFGTSGTERMRILSSGYVGIGTPSPSVALDVNGAARIRSLTSAGIVVSDASGNLSIGSGSNLPSGSGNYIQNGTSTQSANYNITGSGTIGGSLTVGSYQASNAIYGTSASYDTRSTNPNPETYGMGVVREFKLNTSNGLSDGGSYNGVMTFRQWSSGTDWSGGGVHQLGFTDNGNMWHRFSATTGSWGTWYQMAQNQMTNNFSFMGSVGIGIASPGYKLDVAGNARFNAGGSTYVYVGSGGGGYYGDGTNLVTQIPTNGSFYMANVGTDGTRVSQADGTMRVGGPGQTSSNLYVYGNVGIGTTSPSNKLQVEGNMSMDGNPIYFRQGATDQYDMIKWNSSVDKIDIGGYSGVNLGYTSTGGPAAITPVLTVASSNVGISTTSPVSKLDVAGGVITAESGIQTQKTYRFWEIGYNCSGTCSGTWSMGAWDICWLAGYSFTNTSGSAWDDTQCNVYPASWVALSGGGNGNAGDDQTSGNAGGNATFISGNNPANQSNSTSQTYAYNNQPTWYLYAEEYSGTDQTTCNVMCMNFR